MSSAFRRVAVLSSLASHLLFPAVTRAEPTPPGPAAPRPGESPAAPASGPASASEGKHVVYLPESVKAQLREELKKEVLEQARKEGWAAPNLVPAWLSRLRLTGDVRLRGERALFPRGNANGGEFPDFGAINASSPFDVNFVDISGEKYLNVDQDRTRPRLRARMALDADVARGFRVGIRLASGESGTPVSANQTLGASGGSFSKYPIWLDRAFIRVGSGPEERTGISLDIGRFENPFFATALVWGDNVSFDGAAVRGAASLGGGFRAFAAAGAFPVFTTAFAFPTERTQKFASRDRYLFAAQVGAEWRTERTIALKLGVAFYDFYGVEGRASGPCDTHLKGVTCSTDDTRPLVAQKGNTYMPLRTPSDAALVAEAVGSASRYEYFGLASSFRELVATARLELRALEAMKVTLDGELVTNTAFSSRRISSAALNNLGACDAASCDRFAGGNRGALGRFTLGSPAQEVRWAWSAGVEYRHLESDAVLDALNDSDFGLGGTNLKGFGFAASLGLGEGVTATARWSSADAIAGPRYQVDVLQVDLSARF
jgi:hypothetical protein